MSQWVANSDTTLILWNRMGNLEMRVEQFNSLFTFKEDEKNSGWWYTSVRPRTWGSLVLYTPSSIKKWKEEFFFVFGEWQFHPTEENREDVVSDLYHPLCKFISSVFLLADLKRIVLTVNLVFANYKVVTLTSEDRREAEAIRALPKRQRSCKFVISEDNLFQVGLLRAHPLSTTAGTSSSFPATSSKFLHNL